MDKEIWDVHNDKAELKQCVTGTYGLLLNLQGQRSGCNSLKVNFTETCGKGN